MHGDRGALIHQNRHEVLTHASVMGLQGGFYSCNPITIYFRGIRSLFLVRPVLAQLLNEIDDGFEFRSHIV